MTTFCSQNFPPRVGFYKPFALAEQKRLATAPGLGVKLSQLAAAAQLP